MSANQVYVDDAGGKVFEFTSGFDPKEAKSLLVDRIYPEVIKKAQDVLSVEDSDYVKLKNSLDLNWKGEAKTKFIEKLEGGIKALHNQLYNEYNSLYNRFYEMEDNYFKFDQKQSQDV